MVALINENQSKLFNVDSNCFTMALTMPPEENLCDENALKSMYFSGRFFTISTLNNSTTLQISHNNNSQLTAKGILSLISHCNNVRELSLSYSLISDELVKMLSSVEAFHLETLRVEAHPETKPVSKVSCETWSAFTSNYPSVNLVLLTYLTEMKDYDELLVPYVPVTHLYFGDCVPPSVMACIGERCPHLKELVIGTYGPDTIDNTLLSAAKYCPSLTALGLGDCELTCSGLVEFVSLCSERLKILHILETSLIENFEYDVTEVSEKVSSILGKSWQPDYVPYW